MSSPKTFKEFAYDEGFNWPLFSGSDEYIEANEKYLKNVDQASTEEEKEMAMRGDCGNCSRKDMPLSPCNPPLCWRCQKAAEGLKGEERVKALADIREKTEKIINGEVAPNRLGRHKKRRCRPKEKKDEGPNDMTGSGIKPFRFNSKDGAGIAGKLFENYNEKLDEAEEIIALLIGLRKYGVKCEMPKRHIVG